MPISLDDDMAAFLAPHLGRATCLSGLPRTESPSVVAAVGDPTGCREARPSSSRRTGRPPVADEGNVLGPPAPEGVVSYNVQVDGNDIKVELP